MKLLGQTHFLRKDFDWKIVSRNTKQTIYRSYEVFVHKKMLLLLFSIRLFLFC